MLKRNWIPGGTLAACSLWLGGLPCRAQEEFDPAPTTRRFAVVGADISMQERAEAVPGRRYLDFNGKAADAIRFMAENGFNAGRVGDYYVVSPTASAPDNSPGINERERTFKMAFADNDGLDRQIRIAKRLRASGQKVIFTINFGRGNSNEEIPREWVDLTYAQLITEMEEKTRFEIGQFLDAGIQPEIVIVGNEAQNGMLIQEAGAPIRNVTDDPNSLVASGLSRNYPKFAGVFKAPILTMEWVLRSWHLPRRNAQLVESL